MLIQAINSRIRKDQLQQNRDQGELCPPAGKAQIREGGKSEIIANEENKL